MCLNTYTEQPAKPLGWLVKFRPSNPSQPNEQFFGLFGNVV